MEKTTMEDREKTKGRNLHGYQKFDKYVLPLHCTLISLAPGVVKPLPDFQYFQVYF